MNPERLKKQVYNGYAVTKQDAMGLLTAEIEALCDSANALRAHFCGKAFDLCTIVNGKSGRCSEDCKYCAQSAHFSAGVAEYPLMTEDSLRKEAQKCYGQGILRFSVVTSGRTLTHDELERMGKAYAGIRQACPISLCASHGLLSLPQLKQLRRQGVRRYHNNLETSRRFFQSVCTTHTYDDKIRVIKHAQQAGLTVCSGGILGLGETAEDRIDLALELRGLGISSIPLNILTPIPGTPLERVTPITEEDIKRTVAIFRFLLPRAAIRLAGGRGRLADKGAALCAGGANAAITGDMLTTAGISVEEDVAMLHRLGYEVKAL